MTMNNAIKELFGPIRAEEGLKERTREFLARETRSYAKAPAARRGYPAYAAACACLLFLLLGGGWLYFTPTAEISMDINPSIELSVNRFDRVIAVTAFNEDGQELSRELDVKYKDYAQALDQVLHHDSIAALLSAGEVMSITVVGPDGQQSAKLLSGVEACTAGQSNIDCYSARPEEAAAHEAGLSCGKYRAFLELQRLDPDTTPEDVQGMTMREIRDLIDRLSAGGDDDVPSSGSGWGNGHHGSGGQDNGSQGNPASIGGNGNGYHGGGQNGSGHGHHGRAPDNDAATVVQRNGQGRRKGTAPALSLCLGSPLIIPLKYPGSVGG